MIGQLHRVGATPRQLGVAGYSLEYTLRLAGFYDDVKRASGAPDSPAKILENCRSPAFIDISAKLLAARTQA